MASVSGGLSHTGGGGDGGEDGDGDGGGEDATSMSSDANRV